MLTTCIIACNVRISGKTSWGEPTKCLPMGWTWFREDEFIKFVVQELNPVFTKDAYDS